MPASPRVRLVFSDGHECVRRANEWVVVLGTTPVSDQPRQVRALVPGDRVVLGPAGSTARLLEGVEMLPPAGKGRRRKPT